MNDKYSEHKQPSFDFGNLPIDNPITPPNVNLYLKHHGEKIVIVKFMEANASMSDSLRTTLMRIIDDFERSGKDAFLFLCEYAETECGGIVDVSETIVKSTYHHRQWIDDGSNTFGKRYVEFLEENN